MFFVLFSQYSMDHAIIGRAMILVKLLGLSILALLLLVSLLFIIRYFHISEKRTSIDLSFMFRIKSFVMQTSEEGLFCGAFTFVDLIFF